jgi:hypothetical protein
MALHSTSPVVSSTNAILVVHCDGPIDAERLRRSLDRFLQFCPWPAARLRRSFPWGKLHWAVSRHAGLAPPPVRCQTVVTAKELRQAIDVELNTAIDPHRDPPLRFLILAGPPEAVGTGGVLVLTWFHPLMDPRGAQNLLHYLVHLDGHPGDSPWDSTVPVFVRAADQRPFRERGRLARKSLEYMRTLPRALPVSPAQDRAGRVCFRHVSFAERETAAKPSRVTQEIWWRLAVVGKAMRELSQQWSLADVPFVVPIAVDLRPKGDFGPTFGNMLAFHFGRFRPSDVADVPRLASELRDQMADAVRDGQIEANDVAMDFLQYRPLSFIRRALRRTGGETFSFNCADVTDFPAALDRCFGRRVVNAYHVPAVPPRPGIGVFFNRCAGRHNLVVAWIDGVMTDDDVTRIVETVREELGWIETP